MLIDGLNRAATIVHNAARKNGFWDKESSVAEKLMLIVTELGEACEADRNGKRSPGHIPYKPPFDEVDVLVFKEHWKDTFEDELADVMIRLLDLAGGLGIDIEWHVNAKYEYNQTRPYKHGKEY
jgi:NTP pyrophosphatase (non-canonical NTP hydrolase)